MTAAYLETVGHWWQVRPDLCWLALYLLVGLGCVRILLAEQDTPPDAEDIGMMVVTFMLWPLLVAVAVGYGLYRFVVVVVLWRPRSVYQVKAVKDRLQNSAGGEQ